MQDIKLEIEDVKGLREDLCVAQSALGWYGDIDQSAGARERIQAIIDQLDVMRPLGPDGKHGNRHTVDCGCEFPDPTPEQEIDMIDRIIAGLPLVPIPYPSQTEVSQALVDAANTWRRIPDFDNYEVNPLGEIRNRWTRRVLEVDEQGDENYVDMHDKDGFSHIINVRYVLETIYNK